MSEPAKKTRAPTLYAIIALKLLKGLVLVGTAFTAWVLSDNALPDEFRRLIMWLHLDPANDFFGNIAQQLARVTENDALVFAGITLLYSLFSFVEGVGLIFRVSWCGWLAICESIFFIPIEVNSLVKKFTPQVFVILMINVVIVWYLLKNRHRLFRH
jgi:uncharacterized membrane protein (DUF2068 family)